MGGCLVSGKPVTPLTKELHIVGKQGFGDAKFKTFSFVATSNIAQNDFQSLKTVKCKYWQHMFRIEKGFLVEIYVQKLKMKTFGTQFLEN